MFGTEARERAERIGQDVAKLCSDLEPNTVPLHDVPATFDELVAIKKRIDGAIVRMTARYEEAGRWKRSGAKDFEDDLARKTGTSRGKAKAAAKTSRRLKKRPKTDDAVREGKLSMEEADAVSSGAEAFPDDEDDLLDSAGRDPLHELKKKSAQARARADRDKQARRRRQHKLRCLKRWIDDEGMSNHLLRLPPDMGAEIDARLKSDIDRAFSDAHDAGRLEPYEAYAADVAFDLLTGRRTSHYTERRSDAVDTDDESSGTDTAGATTSEPTGATATAPSADPERTGQTTGDSHESDLRRRPGDTDPPSPRTGPPNLATEQPSGRDPTPDQEAAAEQRLPIRPSNRAVRPERKVIVHIDIAALNRGQALPDELCEIPGVGPVPASKVQSMLSDAFVAIVIKDGVDIHNVTHLGRQVTAHQRTALEARGYQCEVEGCGSTHHLEIDHVTGFTLTHDTRIDDLAWLCRHHHDRKTLENLRLTGPPGQRHLAPKQSTAAERGSPVMS